MKNLNLMIFTVIVSLSSNSCINDYPHAEGFSKKVQPQLHANDRGYTISTRIYPPAGFERIKAAPGGFAEYLRSLPLKPEGAAVMQIGDIFIKGGSPGHAVIIADMAVSADLKQKIFLLAQSYMPAQEIHVLKNPTEDDLSPWYRLNIGERLVTPEWVFKKNNLRRFK